MKTSSKNSSAESVSAFSLTVWVLIDTARRGPVSNMYSTGRTAISQDELDQMVQNVTAAVNKIDSSNSEVLICTGDNSPEPGCALSIHVRGASLDFKANRFGITVTRSS